MYECITDTKMRPGPRPTNVCHWSRVTATTLIWFAAKTWLPVYLFSTRVLRCCKLLQTFLMTFQNAQVQHQITPWSELKTKLQKRWVLDVTYLYWQSSWLNTIAVLNYVTHLHGFIHTVLFKVKLFRVKIYWNVHTSNKKHSNWSMH